jgi:hypothetical protein
MIANGVLTEDDYKTPTRNSSKRIVIVEAKVAEILAPLQASRRGEK